MLRFDQEFLNRSQDHAIGVLSTLRFGLDAWDATSGGSPDANFFSWQGRLQYLQRLGDTQNQLVCRISTQIADNPLLAIERFALGGVDTVRGYRENQLIRDNGLTASLELRFPLLFDTAGQGVLAFAPFADLGLGWDDGSPSRAWYITSAGLGVLFNPDERFNAQVYWGYPFRDFDDPEDDIQDLGFHISVTFSMF